MGILAKLYNKQDNKKCEHKSGINIVFYDKTKLLFCAKCGVGLGLTNNQKKILKESNKNGK